MSNSYRIAYYELDQGYGGPEEGGWWYDCGQLVRVSHGEYESREKAQDACCRANGLLRVLQRDRRPVYSVIYTGGRYGARVIEPGEEAPAGFPDTRPYYE